MPHSERATQPEPSERLFLALWPDDAVRAGLAAVRGELAPEGGRRVPAQNLHLTLVFLGDTGAPRRACLERTLGDVEAGAFELVFETVRHRRRSGMVWFEARAVPARLRELLTALGAALVACGHEPERRPFRAHVTLARNVQRPGPRPSVAPVVWPVKDFCLVSSTPTSEGSVYSIARRWPLQIRAR